VDALIRELALTPTTLFAQRDQLPHHRKAWRKVLISLLHIRFGQKGGAQLSPAGVVSGDGVFSAAHFRRWGRTSRCNQVLDGSNSKTSSRERAGMKNAGLSPDARALK